MTTEQFLSGRMADAHALRSHYSVIFWFINSISRMHIRSGYIHGDVLIVGQGAAFPERGLICSPDSMFLVPTPDIHSITTCDYELFSTPDAIDIAWPVRSGDYPWAGIYGHQLTAYSVSAHELFHDYQVPDGTFDTILFFRIPGLRDQLVSGLLREYSDALKTGGKLICSGECSSASRPTGGYAPLYLRSAAPDLHFRSLTRLSDDDSAGSYGFNVGMVLEKR